MGMVKINSSMGKGKNCQQVGNGKINKTHTTYRPWDLNEKWLLEDRVRMDKSQAVFETKREINIEMIILNSFLRITVAKDISYERVKF